ncbi:hypothetical protein WH47_10539 [Habropoda laboriosa]|uniref:Uncharacterized protein n=1 Tax=Habropoda laboriosa TaxID=597456 RepID=A0A0L7QMP8_9HYME|nr:hypothetical protein WH47_10539 [Habropoda laboriosa]
MQNNNESFNSCVWHLAPKHIICGKKIFKIATYCAACIFNEGFALIVKIMDVMGVKIGPEAFTERQNAAPTEIADRRNSIGFKRGSNCFKSEISTE